MKNEFDLSNQFITLEEGVYQFKRKVSTVQFLGGFFFAIIPLIALVLIYREIYYFLTIDWVQFTWEIKGVIINIQCYNEPGNIHSFTMNSNINLLVVFCLLYISLAFIVRNIQTRVANNHDIIINKIQKLVHFNFYKKSFSVPFSELTNFRIKVEKEMAATKGRGLVNVYIVCLVKKDGEEYELMRYKKYKEKADLLLEILSKDLVFDDGPVSAKIPEITLTPFNEQKNGFLWQRKIRWYFWTNCLVFFFIATKLILFSVDFLKNGFSLEIVHMIVFNFILLFGIYAVLVVFIPALRHVFYQNELVLQDKTISFFRVSKLTKTKHLIQKIPFEDVLLVRQMSIKTWRFVGNTGIAIISKKDEKVLEKESETFTKKFKNSIGFNLINDDYPESVAIENYIENELIKGR